MTTVELALRQMDQAFDKKSWHGTNLRGSIRGLTVEQAAWRPPTDGEVPHNIWELVLHAAYWKYTVKRRIEGTERGSFALAGTNFWVRPMGTRLWEADWKRDLALLVKTHQELRAAVVRLTPRKLGSVMEGKSRIVDLVVGIAAHDLYHVGQIQLLKRLQER